MRYRTLRCGAVIVFVTSFVACGNDESPTGPTATPVLFPLAVGNSWVYQLDGATGGVHVIPTITITGTMTIADETYYTVEATNVGPSPGLHSSEIVPVMLLQNRRDGLFFSRYDEQSGFSDELLFVFPPPETAREGNADSGRDPGYAYRRQSGEVIHVQVRDVQVTVAGRTLDSLEYRWGDDAFATFAVDVGCVQAFDLFWPDRFMELVSSE